MWKDLPIPCCVQSIFDMMWNAGWLLIIGLNSKVQWHSSSKRAACQSWPVSLLLRNVFFEMKSKGDPFMATHCQYTQSAYKTNPRMARQYKAIWKWNCKVEKWGLAGSHVIHAPPFRLPRWLARRLHLELLDPLRGVAHVTESKEYTT